MLFFVLALTALFIDDGNARIQDDFASQYDFIIVGGGTGGLVVANRLSEMRNITVAVIEAGDSVLNDHNVTEVMGYGLSFGSDVDWAYQTENQTYAGGSMQTMRAGKAIGGTSTINGDRCHNLWGSSTDADAVFFTQECPTPELSTSKLTPGNGWETRDGIGITSFATTRSPKASKCPPRTKFLMALTTMLSITG